MVRSYAAIHASAHHPSSSYDPSIHFHPTSYDPSVGIGVAAAAVNEATLDEAVADGDAGEFGSNLPNGNGFDFGPI